MAQRDWQNSARCKDDPKFQDFPNEWDTKAVKYSKSVCFKCPVRLECLAQSYVNNEVSGIYGGYLYKERIMLKALLDIPSSASLSEIVDNQLIPLQRNSHTRNGTSYNPKPVEFQTLNGFDFSSTRSFVPGLSSLAFADTPRQLDISSSDFSWLISDD